MRLKKWNYQPVLNVLMTLAIGLIFIPTLPPKVGSIPMAIDFDGSDDRVSFSAKTSLDNLAAFSVCFWVNPDTLPGPGALYQMSAAKVSSATAGWYIHLGDSGEFSKTNMVMFVYGYGTTWGVWTTANGTMSTGAWQHVCITYTRGTGNDPIVYIAGASSAVTENQTPSGSTLDDSVSVVEIGGSVVGSAASSDGKIADVRIYPFILTAADVLNMYSSRSMNVHPVQGLPVFQPVLYGAAALQAYDGVALGTANKIVDPYSGALGTPSGSPLGVAETYLRVGP